MTEFCPVLPTALYSLLDVSYPGGWHFVHAPQVVSLDGGRLVHSLKSHQGTIILDCYAYELNGKLPCFKDIYEAATILKDDDCRGNLIIVCPDVVKDGNQSFELLKQHGPALSGYGRLMVVPHGDNLFSWMSWAEQCLDFCQNMGIRIPIVGVPRYMSDWGPTARYKAALWLHHYFHARVHLLGAGQGLEEAEMAARAPSVMSCDSTAPFAYAMKYGLGNLASLRGKKVEMRSDWWGLVPAAVPVDLIRAAQVNIAIWKEALRRDIYPEPYLCQ